MIWNAHNLEFRLVDYPEMIERHTNKQTEIFTDKARSSENSRKCQQVNSSVCKCTASPAPSGGQEAAWSASQRPVSQRRPGGREGNFVCEGNEGVKGELDQWTSDSGPVTLS